MASLRQENGIKVEEIPGLGFTHLSFNMDRKSLQDVNVRRAIAHAINYDAIRKVAVQGQGISAHSSPITPSLKKYFDPSWTEYSYDPTEAKRLLQQAGVTNLQLTMIYSMQDPVIAAWATMVRDSLKDVGITLKLQGLDRNTYLSQTAEGDYDIYAGSYAIMDEPVSNMSLQYLPNAAINRAHVNDPNLTALIQQAQGTTDDAERKALVQQAASRVQDQVYEDIMYVQNLYVAHSDDWTGFVVRPSELLSVIDPESLAQAHPAG